MSLNKVENDVMFIFELSCHFMIIYFKTRRTWVYVVKISEMGIENHCEYLLIIVANREKVVF